MSSQHDIARQLAEGVPYSEIISRLTRDIAVGAVQTASFTLIERYVVLEVFSNAKMLTEEKFDELAKLYGVNAPSEDLLYYPHGPILAQKINDGSAGLPIPTFIYPFFPPHLQFPINSGEHVWVLREAYGAGSTPKCYYLFRVNEPRHTDDLNHTHAPRAYSERSTPEKSSQAGDSEPKYDYANGASSDDDEGGVYTDSATSPLLISQDSTITPDRAYEHLVTESDTAKQTTYEAVPRYKKRPGEFALQGSNNTLISLGTFRDDGSLEIPADSFNQKKGTIDIVVGRGRGTKTAAKVVKTKSLDDAELYDEIDKSYVAENDKEGDPDYATDAGRIILTIDGDVDNSFGIKDDVKSNGASNSSGPSIVVKSDHLRYVARKSLSIVITGTKQENGVESDATSYDDKIVLTFDAETGDIIMKPAKKGVIKLGGPNANKAIACTSEPAVNANGQVTAPPMISTMAGATCTGIPGQGTWAKKILVE